MRLLLVLAIFLTFPLFAAEKLPIPDANSQKEAETTIKEVFKEDFAKTKPEDRVSLAQKLLKQAEDSKSDKAAFYVLMRESCNSAALAGDLDMTMSVISQISETFAVEISPLTKTTLSIVAANTKDAETTKAINGMRTLLDNPSDMVANLLVGRYYCFLRLNWPKGLPFLEKGNDATLKSIAEKEKLNPTDAVEQMALADQWWGVAENESSKAYKLSMQVRSKEWYEKSVYVLTGLQKAKVEKRLETLSKLELPTPRVQAETNKAVPEKLPPAQTQDASKSFIIEIGPRINATQSAIEANAPFVSGRSFRITKFPDEMKGAVVLVRHVDDYRNWLDKGVLKLNKQAVVFFAVQWKRDNKVIVSDKEFARFATEGWTDVAGEFSTTTWDKEQWSWRIFKRLHGSGPVDLPQAGISRAAYIFCFKPSAGK